MSDLLTFQTAEIKSLKSRIKIGLGNVFSGLFPNRAKKLLQSPTSYPLSVSDKMIMAYLKERARVKNDTNFIEHLHQSFWSGHGGSVFSTNCDHRFEDLFLAKQKEEFDRLQGIWNRGDCRNIVEFGCCSGLLLQYFTTVLGDVETAVGIDINKDQITANQSNPDFDSIIQFKCEDGGEWLFANGKPNTLFVSNGGVLEYFSRNRLDQMLTHISSELGPATFFAVEPIAPDHDWTSTKDSIPFGEELSFSHNYTDLFQSNGFKVVHQRHVDFESWRMMATIAVTRS